MISSILAFGQRFQVFGIIKWTQELYGVAGERLTTFSTVKQRVVGTHGNANMFGCSLVMLSAIALAFSINIKGLIKYISLAVFLLLGVTTVFTTASRTAIFGYMVISAMSVVFCMRRGSRLSAFLLLSILIGAIMFMSGHLYEFGLHERVRDLFTRKGHLEDSYHIRHDMWIGGLKKAGESPIYGVAPSKVRWQTIDNGYIFILMTMGIVGLSLYLLMLVSLFIKGMKAFGHEVDPYKKAFMLALIMVLVNHCVFEITGEFFWNVLHGQVLAVFLGLLCSFATQIRQEQQQYYYSKDHENYYDDSDLLAEDTGGKL